MAWLAFGGNRAHVRKRSCPSHIRHRVGWLAKHLAKRWSPQYPVVTRYFVRISLPSRVSSACSALRYGEFQCALFPATVPRCQATWPPVPARVSGSSVSVAVQHATARRQKSPHTWLLTGIDHKGVLRLLQRTTLALLQNRREPAAVHQMRRIPCNPECLSASDTARYGLRQTVPHH